MTALPMPDESDIPVSEARERLAEVIAAAEAGNVIHLTRHGRRVAAVVPEAMTERASSRVRASAERIAERHRKLLDRLAE
ncbi:type II toxin-antitoxin system prevent-host-death family antitoxin [Nocardia cyriacigeorgica]|uniref:type II toxin-antitoxin system prevent-host-death family antitoxin n=1 Tax=Nocardia cyriacigeorgica TaxID=135487 RepID=UPI001894FB0C|nr:type II toxin-antitoxin system prevent-host-death family antitoxin [Nocardia cyriacigeorgica]MBF6438353.1 type II toxin-antitoxin system prevent-host-death family antitoxin [Nocardia cyriacigeorgica]MBF6456250.1 type II toxin-antitoxin system prevent-host-death family antitoxin [Nocardia cyriacigeorgica]MBF6477349.1 type II toxin-antitoxin system prevent-host-death family antitoxin [Nocardia cyriacigeorgica]MBF6551056.1 type II toxin-antitoxin system prevent-host-death family antitoxin [Noca